MEVYHGYVLDLPGIKGSSCCWSWSKVATCGRIKRSLRCKSSNDGFSDVHVELQERCKVEGPTSALQSSPASLGLQSVCSICLAAGTNPPAPVSSTRKRQCREHTISPGWFLYQSNRPYDDPTTCLLAVLSHRIPADLAVKSQANLAIRATAINNNYVI